jgi:hypothetical protein
MFMFFAALQVLLDYVFLYLTGRKKQFSKTDFVNVLLIGLFIYQINLILT